MLRSTLLIVFCALATTVAFGQDDAAFQGYMKAMAPSFGPLRMAIMAKDAAGAAAAAAKLQATFDEVLAYWQKKNVADAIMFATTGRDAAKAIAGSSDADAQAANMQKLQGTCGGCHMAHRGGAAPNFTIK